MAVPNVNSLAKMMFSGLSPLVVEDVADRGDDIVVRARTPGRPVACPACGLQTTKVHGYYMRQLSDVPVDTRRVVLEVRVLGVDLSSLPAG
jgi:transposase